jgi:hypothetical protein
MRANFNNQLARHSASAFKSQIYFCAIDTAPSFERAIANEFDEEARQ